MTYNFDLASKSYNVAEVYIDKDDDLKIEYVFGDAIYIPVKHLIAYLKAEGRINDGEEA